VLYPCLGRFLGPMLAGAAMSPSSMSVTGNAARREVSMGEPLFTTLGALESARRIADRRYLEFLRVPDLSAGLYVLEAGAADPQRPHAEDEVYVVMAGRCRFRVGTGEQEVQPGSVLFVPARLEHRFLELRERLEALVFFGPSEGSRS
jgi:mannose-6-phosphate isomerase-like protein (cupin superfamily)